MIRGGALGDFVLTLPVLSALRARHPSARIELICSPQTAELAVAGGLVQAAHSIDSRVMTGFFSSGTALDPAMADRFRRADVVLSFLHDPERLFESNVRTVTRGIFLRGPHRPRDQAGLHATACFLEALEPMGIVGTDPVPRLELPSKPHSMEAGESRPLAMHPGSGSASKNWPPQRWRGLMHRVIRRTDWPIWVLEGEAEAGLGGSLAAGFPGDRVTVLRERPLIEVATRLMTCRLFIGHDSGITHLAAALGIRGVALWGPSCEQVWRPLSPRFTVLRHSEGIRAIEVERVWSVLD